MDSSAVTTALKPDVHLSNIYKFSSYLTGNTLRLRYKAQRLILFRETVAVYCETMRNTQIHCVGRTYSNSVRTLQETHYVSATKPNRLILFRETVAVYCENHTEHTNTLCGQNAEVMNLTAGGTHNN
jgi:hypothetical protein